jgi:hypothetical protein
VEIDQVETYGEDGLARREFESGEPLTVKMSYRCQEPTPFTVISGVMERYNGQTVLAAWSGDDGVAVPASGHGTLEIRYPALPLAAGDYGLYVALAAPEEGAWPTRHLDMWHPLLGHDTMIHVRGPRHDGLVDLPVTWSVGAAVA